MEVVLNESNSQPMKQILSNISDDFNSLYEITEEIGRGGFSVVYKCKNKINNQIYAVKAIDLRPLRLRENFNPKRLKREVDIMKGMNHPNIIQFVHVYENDNQLLVVMEYAPGKELFDVILEKSKFTEEEAKPIFYQIASALSYMHSMGVIHRDIKPENILVLHDPDPITGIPIIKILDFGLSKHTGGGSLAKTFVGTPCYLAPEVEQASLNNGSSYDTPADCWSLGAVLYVMLVAHFPEFDRNVGRVGRIVLRLPQHLWKDISSDAKNLVQGLLCYEIDVRLTAADAMKHQWIGNYSNVVHQTKNYQIAYAPPSKKTQQSNKKVYDLVTKNQDSSNRRYFEIPPISIPPHIHNIPPIPPQSAFQQYSKPPQVDNTIPSEYLQSSPTNMITSTQYNPNMLNSYGHPGDIIYGSMVENNSDVCFRIVPLITLQREAIKCFQNAEKTYANRPDVATHIRTASLRCRQQIQDSLNMLRKIEQTSLAALNIIPDMEYALEVGEPQLIGDFLGTIKTWVAELINLVVNTQKSNEETIQNLHKAVNISDHLQLTSKNLLAASDPLIIDSNMVVNEIRRVVGELQERRKNQGLTDQDILELFSNLFGQENWKERGVIYSVSPSSSSHGKKHHRSQGSPTSSSDVEETIIGGSPAIISTIDNQNNQRVDIKRMDDMISALTVLREVDEILAHLSIFWSNTDVILDALSKKGQHIEKFITYTSNPNLVIRFRERILEYRRFWEKVNSMCTAYLLGMENPDSLSRVVTPPEEVFSSPQSSVS